MTFQTGNFCGLGSLEELFFPLISSIFSKGFTGNTKRFCQACVPWKRCKFHFIYINTGSQKKYHNYMKYSSAKELTQQLLRKTSFWFFYSNHISFSASFLSAVAREEDSSFLLMKKEDLIPIRLFASPLGQTSFFAPIIYDPGQWGGEGSPGRSKYSDIGGTGCSQVAKNCLWVLQGFVSFLWNGSSWGLPIKGLGPAWGFPCESPKRAESFCLISASPEWVTEQWWQQPPCKWGEMCRKAAAACFQSVRTFPWPWVYYFYCFYWNIVCMHTQTQKYIIIVNFGPRFMTSSLPLVKTFFSVCSLAVFADKGYNSGGSFSKIS